MNDVDERVGNMEYVALNRTLTTVEIMIHDLMSFDPEAQKIMLELVGKSKEVYHVAVGLTKE